MDSHIIQKSNIKWRYLIFIPLLIGSMEALYADNGPSIDKTLLLIGINLFLFSIFKLSETDNEKHMASLVTLKMIETSDYSATDIQMKDDDIPIAEYMMKKLALLNLSVLSLLAGITLVTYNKYGFSYGFAVVTFFYLFFLLFYILLYRVIK